MRRLALGLALLAAALVAATLVRPLRRLTETTERMSRGDLSARARVGGGSELAQLADAFNHLASTLAREDELRRAAAADIAHELRTPVAGIVSRIEAAQDGVMADERANLEAMHAEALRLAALIDDVGKLAEAERPDLLLSRAPLDLADTCAGAPRCTRASSPRRASPSRPTSSRRRCTATPAGSSRSSTTSSRTRCATPTRAARSSCTSRASAACIVEVRDTGIGISPEDLPHVFDRFWRSDRSRSRATGGSGIGLAVVRELVRAHQGRVELHSEIGGGTTARVVLPRASRCSARRCAPRPPGPDRGGAPPAGRGRGLESAPP